MTFKLPSAEKLSAYLSSEEGRAATEAWVADWRKNLNESINKVYDEPIIFVCREASEEEYVNGGGTNYTAISHVDAANKHAEYLRSRGNTDPTLDIYSVKDSSLDGCQGHTDGYLIKCTYEENT